MSIKNFATHIALFVLVFINLNCKNETIEPQRKYQSKVKPETTKPATQVIEVEKKEINDQAVILQKEIQSTDASSARLDSKAGWKELTTNQGFLIDIKYATKDNFMKQKVYDCSRCYLISEAAEALDQANKELMENYGYKFKLLDCYRPKPYQQRLWDITPDINYVAHPSKGSMHSRGLAVDLTIVDQNNNELDMGTPFDFFGEEAHQDYEQHNAEVTRNRALLKTTMEKFGFGSIRTEWWHYSFRKINHPLEEWLWSCR